MCLFVSSTNFSLPPRLPFKLCELKSEALGLFFILFWITKLLKLCPALAFNDYYVHLLDNLLTDLCSTRLPTRHLGYISLINTPYIFILWSIPSDPLLWHRRLYTSSELSLGGWSSRAEAQLVSILHYSLSFCPGIPPLHCQIYARKTL